jgi:hypothetical protein
VFVLLAVRLRVGALAVARIEVRDDPIGAVVNDSPIVEHKRWDLVVACLSAQLLAISRVRRHLSRYVRDPKLGEALADSV